MRYAFLHIVAALVLAAFCLGAVPARALAAPGAILAMDRAGDMGRVESVDILRLVSEARGKVVVINFWASWCRPCRLEIPELMRVRSDFSRDEVVILGVSVDQNPAMYDAFVAKAAFNYPVALAARDLAEMFQVGQVPRLMIYDPLGRLALNREGVTTASSLSRFIRTLLDG